MESVTWYQAFNLAEAVLWWCAAMVIVCRVPCASLQQRGAVVLGGISFIAFGVTDVLEATHEHWIPLWLWGFKVLCGVGIFSARYTWRGWNRFRWSDREFLFGLGCLIAVMMLVWLQFRITEGGL
jgi:hypothetical protein